MKILREKTTGQLSLLPFISLFTNCVIWTWYGYLLQDSTIMLPNASGLVVGLIYTSIFLRHAASNQTPMLLGSAAICGAVTAGALMMPAAQVAPYIGYLGDVVAVVLMASPLAVVRTVLKEKSTRAMPFGTSVATFFNAICWSGYGKRLAAVAVLHCFGGPPRKKTIPTGAFWEHRPAWAAG
jgi:solute carrier family 50 protein (sugar transporter)